MKLLARIAFAFLVLLGLPLHAQIGEWQHHDAGTMRLIASTKATDDGALTAALHLKLNPGWHTYWRSPGDAGLAPTPDWKDSVNLDKAELQFPYPHRYNEQGLTTNGYEGEIVFPLKITKKDPAAALDLKAKLTLLVCSDICVPADFNLGLSVPAGFASVDGDEATVLIKTYLAKVPKQDDGQGLSLISAALADKTLTVHYAAPAPINDVLLLGEVGDTTTIPYTDLANDVQGKIITVQLTKDAPKDLGGKEITFTLVDNSTQTAVEKKLTITNAASPMPIQPMPKANIWIMIAFALIGGLILNLMPCVLPVLALKSLAFISHGGGTPSGVRLSFL
ncbi:MAG: hypothetical protein EB059_09590, partial [Alphaproteobacteria bacterium]|nr:hypothetical protein [Alphaproteobacteria bacterium]